jgi:hypothetical protein
VSSLGFFLFFEFFPSVLSRMFLSWTEAETRPPPSANNRDVDRKARAEDSFATMLLLPRELLVATKAVAALCDIVVVPARNIIPIVVAKDDDTTDDFIILFGFFLCCNINSGNVNSMLSQRRWGRLKSFGDSYRNNCFAIGWYFSP